jgi:hypothetical protein
MKINLIIFFIALTFLMYCKSDNIQYLIENSLTPKLDLAYYAVVKSEMEELGNSIRIVDKTIDTTSTILKDIIPSFSKELKTVYWKKEIFPRAEYINGDSLASYINGRPEKYWAYRDQYKSGWIELTAPYFTKDKKRVLIEVSFFHGRSFGVSSYYLLEWTRKGYVVKEKGLISIS